MIAPWISFMGKRQDTEDHSPPAGVPGQREIFDEYHGRVCGFFKSRGFTEDEALDLTQETLIRVFQNMDKLRSRAALEPWILRVAANLWKNELRYRKAEKRDAQEVSLDDVGAEHEAIEQAASESRDVPSPLDEVLSAERLLAAGKCLDRLPPRMRRCLVLHVFQERKYQEIADLLQVSIQSVKSHIHQARQRLEECIARRLAGEER
jgi:RNA polymerase sigma-70 factor (ECF subfamily)